MIAGPLVAPLQFRIPLVGTNVSIWAYDIAMLFIAVIIATGVVILAVLSRPIPDVLSISLASIISFLYGKSKGAN